jgi:DNA helicase II / ATP-dependent DNA helicase PcrA
MEYHRMSFFKAKIAITPEQESIQLARERTIIVQANAGAAKTTTLALRIGQALAQGTRAESILALTYTEPACQAMTQALLKVGVSAEHVRCVRIQTFEQFSSHILLGLERKKIPCHNTPEALAPTVWQALAALNSGFDNPSTLVEEFLAVAQKLKGTLAREQFLWADEPITADVAEELGIEHFLLRLFAAYEHIRYPEGDHCDHAKFRGPFDASYDLARLIANPNSISPVCEMSEMTVWPTGLQLIVADEMHDLNLATFTLLQALLQSNQAFFCGMGDVDQVLHETGGAEARFMSFQVDFGAGRVVKTYPLSASWRFGKSLSKLAGRFSGKPYASAAEHSTQINFLPYGAEISCEQQVLAQVHAYKALNPHNMNGLAILLRHPYQSILLENTLLQAGIRYQFLGFKSYLRQPEVLLIRALLAVHAQDFSSIDSKKTRQELVQTLVFFCGVQLEFKGAESETPEQRLKEAIAVIANDASMLPVFFEEQILRRSDPVIARRLKNAIQACKIQGPDLLPGVLSALDIDSWVQTVFVEKQRRADARAYLEGLIHAAKSYPNAQAFFAGLNQSENQLTNGISERIQKQKATVQKKKTLTLASIAAVKGLEFEHIVVPYLKQGKFPAHLAESNQQERNLFYVAITRARHTLSLITHQSQPSEFSTEFL